MKEFLTDLTRWVDEGISFTVATVVKTWGSSPRPIGSQMLINARGEFMGSVSGGCVEGAVVNEALEVIRNGEAKDLSFGVTDEDAWSVGLACGGSIRVFLEQFPPPRESGDTHDLWRVLLERLTTGEPLVLVTELSERKNRHGLYTPTGTALGLCRTEEFHEVAKRMFFERRHGIYETTDGHYFVQIFPPRSRMLVIGAAHITVHLVELARLYDFETILIDPRGAFTESVSMRARADVIIKEYPSEALKKFDMNAYTYAIVLSHDPKIDDNALEVLLRSEVAYIGALGSRKTHQKRIKRLLESGFTETEIERINAPIGLDINAKSPAEIALSVMAQVIQYKNSYA